MKLSELLDQIDEFKSAASLLGDDDPRLFFLVNRDDSQQVPCTNVYLAFDHSEQKTRFIFW